MDSFIQSAPSDAKFYAPELMQGPCPIEKNTKMVADPRFEAIGLYTDEYEVQANNGVLAILSN
jgi:hypothetical protein